MAALGYADNPNYCTRQDVTSQNEVLEPIRNLEAVPFTDKEDTKKGLTLSRVAIIVGRSSQTSQNPGGWGGNQSQGSYRQGINQGPDKAEEERLKEVTAINERNQEQTNL